MPDDCVTQMTSANRLLPADGQSAEDFRRALRVYYLGLAGAVDRFLSGLAAVERLPGWNGTGL